MGKLNELRCSLNWTGAAHLVLLREDLHQLCVNLLRFVRHLHVAVMHQDEVLVFVAGGGRHLRTQDRQSAPRVDSGSRSVIVPRGEICYVRMLTNALNRTLLFRCLPFQFPAIKNKCSCTLTLLMSTAPPPRTPSMMGSKLLAVRNRALACSMSFFCLACRAAFMYCFFLPSRNSSCCTAGGQKKTIEYNL